MVLSAMGMATTSMKTSTGTSAHSRVIAALNKPSSVSVLTVDTLPLPPPPAFAFPPPPPRSIRRESFSTPPKPSSKDNVALKNTPLADGTTLVSTRLSAPSSYETIMEK